MPRESSTKTVGKIVLIVISVLIVSLVILGFSGYQYWSRSLEPKDSANAQVIKVDIPSGATRSDIATILEDADVIESAFVFNTYSRLNNIEGFQAGQYQLSQAMSVEKVIETLTTGGGDTGDVFKVLIPEGYNIEQIADILDKETQYSKEAVLSLIQDDTFLAGLAEDFSFMLSDTMQIDDTRYKLEGYLYPATYEFSTNESLESMIRKMIARMNEELQHYADDIAASRFTVHEVLTLASIIEREGVTTKDRQFISSVFHNRLDEQMPLQTDISILYAHNEHREDVYYKDLEIDSPYNSYKHPGLIIGPVDNPSGESIEAALHPKETDYLYFLANLKTGEVYYAKTYEEHLALKSEHLDGADTEE